MSEKLPLDGFEWNETNITEDYDKNYENGKIGYFSDVDVEYSERCRRCIANHRSFLKKMNICKCETLL